MRNCFINLLLLLIFSACYAERGPQYCIEDGDKIICFDLVDPESAPLEIRDKVMLGFRILLNTKAHAGAYVGNSLNCTDCHFCCGNTLGGKSGSISLVGVPYTYPRYSPRDKKTIALTDRISNCFMRSMNGKAPPLDSEVMEAIVAYLDWISRDVKNFSSPPWLGLEEIRSNHKPDPNAGAQVYADRCSICHGSHGEGTKGIPPLWGNNSFNDGAGMNIISKISAFVYLNMPYKAPDLTIEQALDVSSYIISQPRPHFYKPASKESKATDTKSK